MLWSAFRYIALYLSLSLWIKQTQSNTLQTGLVGYYPFNGNANDESGNGNNGVAYSTTLTSDRFGNMNSAYRFDGKSSYIEISNGYPFNLGNEFSISLWICPETVKTTTGARLLDKSSNVTASWALVRPTGTSSNAFIINYNNIFRNGAVLIPSKIWTHFLFIKQKNNILTTYVNSLLFRTSNTTASFVLPNGNLPLTIGGFNSQRTSPASGITQFFNGSLDDIFIYNRSLSRAEVTQLFQFDAPTSMPSNQPSSQPSRNPTGFPTSLPSMLPTAQPSAQPSSKPSRKPSSQPTLIPSNQPSNHPTARPSAQPSTQPSSQPSNRPTSQPTHFFSMYTYVNTQNVPSLTYPSIVSLTNGGFAVAWQGRDQDGSGIFVQVYDQHYRQLSATDILVNTNNTAGNQVSAAITRFNDGFVVAWISQTTQIQAQKFSANGAKIDQTFLVATSTACSVLSPYVTAGHFSSGGFILAWAGSLNSWCNSYAQLYDHLGHAIWSSPRSIASNPVNTRISPYLFSQHDWVTVTFSSDDGARGGSCLPNGHAKAYNSTGNVVITEFSISAYPCEYGPMFTSVMRNQSDIYFLWHARDTNNRWQIYLKRYLNKQLSTIKTQISSSTTSYNNFYPAGIILNNTNLMMAWHQYRNGFKDAIFVQQIDSHNNVISAPLMVSNLTTTGVNVDISHPDFPAMDKLLDQQVVLVWSCKASIGYGVCIQLFDTNGQRLHAITKSPTYQPSSSPSRQPSSRPSTRPSAQPSTQPSSKPSNQPSSIPTKRPTASPSSTPSNQPSGKPSRVPSTRPSSQPSRKPSSKPSTQPSTQPSSKPSNQPSSIPTKRPTASPSSTPSNQPSGKPSRVPSAQPSSKPSTQPSTQPSSKPSNQPSSMPTRKPTASPSSTPSNQPSGKPSRVPSAQPSSQPSRKPSGQPTSMPSSQPSHRPSARPSIQPSSQPSTQPSTQPSSRPSSNQPSGKPSRAPSTMPNGQPSNKPSGHPSARPSMELSNKPSTQPTSMPSSQPSNRPSTRPSMRPSSRPSNQPSSMPTKRPTALPSSMPSNQPSAKPSRIPSMKPTAQPSNQPSGQPSGQPTSEPSSQPSTQPIAHPSLHPSFSSIDMTNSSLSWNSTISVEIPNTFTITPLRINTTMYAFYDYAILKVISLPHKNRLSRFTLSGKPIDACLLSPHSFVLLLLNEQRAQYRIIAWDMKHDNILWDHFVSRHQGDLIELACLINSLTSSTTISIGSPNFLFLLDASGAWLRAYDFRKQNALTLAAISNWPTFSGGISLLKSWIDQKTTLALSFFNQNFFAPLAMMSFNSAKPALISSVVTTTDQNKIASALQYQTEAEQPWQSMLLLFTLIGGYYQVIQSSCADFPDNNSLSSVVFLNQEVIAFGLVNQRELLYLHMNTDGYREALLWKQPDLSVTHISATVINAELQLMLVLKNNSSDVESWMSFFSISMLFELLGNSSWHNVTEYFTTCQVNSRRANYFPTAPLFNFLDQNITVSPTVDPTLGPTILPSINPTDRLPTNWPTTYQPSSLPSSAPSLRAGHSASPSFSHKPTRAPSKKPSKVPSFIPSTSPTNILPSIQASNSKRPSRLPSFRPTYHPSVVRSLRPTENPSNPIIIWLNTTANVTAQAAVYLSLWNNILSNMSDKRVIVPTTGLFFLLVLTLFVGYGYCQCNINKAKNKKKYKHDDYKTMMMLEEEKKEEKEEKEEKSDNTFTNNEPDISLFWTLPNILETQQLTKKSSEASSSNEEANISEESFKM